MSSRRSQAVKHEGRPPDLSPQHATSLDSDEDEIDSYRSDFVAALSAAIESESAVTLQCPSLKYSGVTAGQAPEFEMMQWLVDITMDIASDNDEEWGEKQLKVGFLELFTLAVEDAVNALDAISADTAEYLKLFSGRTISGAIEDQFGGFPLSGLLILDRAYVHRALRGRNLGAWAVAQAIRHLTFGAGGILVVAYPAPTQIRSGVSSREGAERLAQHWSTVGLQPIWACPEIVGQTTSAEILDDARSAITGVADLEVLVPVADLMKA